MAAIPRSRADAGGSLRPGDLLAVGIGGALGTLLRAGGLLGGHALEDRGWMEGLEAGTGLPTPVLVTLTENLLGALALGVLIGLILTRELGTRQMRLLLTTGLLGSFTTFSALAVDAALLMGEGALLYLALSLGGGVVLAALGLRMGRAGS